MDGFLDLAENAPSGRQSENELSFVKRMLGFPSAVILFAGEAVLRKLVTGNLNVSIIFS